MDIRLLQSGERDSAPADDRARVVDFGHKVRSAATDEVMVKRRVEAGMPRTNWLLLAAVAVLPLLVPPSAVAWDLLPLEDRLALEATEISSAKVCGASECRELSDPEAATALAVGPTPRGYGRA